MLKASPRAQLHLQRVAGDLSLGGDSSSSCQQSSLRRGFSSPSPSAKRPARSESMNAGGSNVEGKLVKSREDDTCKKNYPQYHIHHDKENFDSVEGDQQEDEVMSINKNNDPSHTNRYVALLTAGTAAAVCLSDEGSENDGANSAIPQDAVQKVEKERGSSHDNCMKCTTSEDENFAINIDEQKDNEGNEGQQRYETSGYSYDMEPSEGDAPGEARELPGGSPDAMDAATEEPAAAAVERGPVEEEEQEEYPTEDPAEGALPIHYEDEEAPSEDYYHIGAEDDVASAGKAAESTGVADPTLEDGVVKDERSAGAKQPTAAERHKNETNKNGDLSAGRYYSCEASSSEEEEEENDGDDDEDVNAVRDLPDKPMAGEDDDSSESAADNDGDAAECPNEDVCEDSDDHEPYPDESHTQDGEEQLGKDDTQEEGSEVAGDGECPAEEGGNATNESPSQAANLMFEDDNDDDDDDMYADVYGENDQSNMDDDTVSSSHEEGEIDEEDIKNELINAIVQVDKFFSMPADHVLRDTAPHLRLVEERADPAEIPATTAEAVIIVKNAPAKVLANYDILRHVFSVRSPRSSEDSENGDVTGANPLLNAYRKQVETALAPGPTLHTASPPAAATSAANTATEEYHSLPGSLEEVLQVLSVEREGRGRAALEATEVTECATLSMQAAADASRATAATAPAVTSHDIADASSNSLEEPEVQTPGLSSTDVSTSRYYAAVPKTMKEVSMYEHAARRGVNAEQQKKFLSILTEAENSLHNNMATVMCETPIPYSRIDITTKPYLGMDSAKLGPQSSATTIGVRTLRSYKVPPPPSLPASTLLEKIGAEKEIAQIRMDLKMARERIEILEDANAALRLALKDETTSRRASTGSQNASLNSWRL